MKATLEAGTDVQSMRANIWALFWMASILA
ncbi:hypothetical protein SAMN05421664_2941 [Chryseobacterium soldanellicola]|uniref:Uncharacterized protein n=1 Tax=Chryseobacterium soldanellicola TaxID=311333 RepID=A0A1H1FA37_9FLAO|nr:hypothetical protein SAMN05421664_2941 [Chryseobacterium soldanellicola]